MIEEEKGQRWVRALVKWVIAGGGLGTLAMLIPAVFIVDEPITLTVVIVFLVMSVVIGGTMSGSTTLAGGLFGYVLMRFMAPDKLVRGVTVFAAVGVIAGTGFVLLLSLALFLYASAAG